MAQTISRNVALSLLLLAGTAIAQPQSTESKVDRLVRGSGFTSRHPKAGAWILDAKGQNIGSYELFVAVSGDIVVAGAVVAKKSQLPLNPALFQTMLRSNHDMDFVKIGLDGDGDAFVRIEISGRILDAVEFKKIIDQVVAATDAEYLRIKPYLK